MTAPDRVWTWSIHTPTDIAAHGSGYYRATPRRPLDDPEGPTGTAYVRADLYAALVEINESQARDLRAKNGRD